MLRSMFSSVSGLRTHQTMLDVTSNNLSNVNTFGYKHSRTTFEDSVYQTVRGGSVGVAGANGAVNPMQMGLGSRAASIDGVFSQGAMMLTSRTMDAAIEGEGFFVVQDPTGQELYTRAGVFNWDNAGNMVTSGGDLVIGWNGSNPPDATPPATGGAPAPITVDPAALATLSDIAIGADGTVTARDGAGGQVFVGHIALASFQNPGGLTRVGLTKFGESGASGAPDIGEPQTGARGGLLAGTLEMSNVDVSQEFTQMIMAQRGFQANARGITVSDEILQELVNIKR